MTAEVTAEELPERPVDPDWLALREPADARARELAEEILLPPLLARLAGADGGGRELRVVDLGAGTGANCRWLAPRLGNPLRQHWTGVDHDPRLSTLGPARSSTVRAEVGELGKVLAELGGTDLVTTSALLDLLDPGQLAAVVDAVVAAGVPALFVLSVTGEAVIDPADGRDGVLKEAFDSHQRRDGRLGPDAPAAAGQLFRARGWTVVTVDTPWRLAARDEPELVDAWLAGRVEAAVEHRPELADAGEAWLAERSRQVAGGRLTAVVGHVDLLALPPLAGGPHR